MTNIFKKTISKYGETAQLVVAMEECGELIQACSKFFRGAEFSAYDVLEEIVDVEIMIQQLKIIVDSKLGMSESTKYYNMLVKRKLERLEERCNE